MRVFRIDSSQYQSWNTTSEKSLLKQWQFALKGTEPSLVVNLMVRNDPLTAVMLMFSIHIPQQIPVKNSSGRWRRCSHSQIYEGYA